MALVLFLLLVVGELLVFAIYGKAAALSALLCLLPGAGIIFFLWLLLVLVERWLDKA